LTTDIQTFALGEKPTSADVLRLSDFLKQAQGSPVCVDASGTDFIPTLWLQAILSAEQSWLSAGLRFDLSNVNETCCNGLSTLGVDPSRFSVEATE